MTGAPNRLSYEGPKNFMKVVIPRNSRIPLMKESALTTKSDNQPAIHFSIYEGESSVANENNFLGKVCIEGISPASWGVPQFDVFFDIDANGILSVPAEEISTGQKKGIAINSDRRNFGGIEMVDYADETAS
uniref:heat shock 70 kDa protein-like n=1 Tax=Fragaria vesca subsp. vesca TaxID=101020 RepID=UPI0005C8B5DB|nr:PREDICTED: heat shock 70 kDa protein-like [Fragaria vesca subsp. vesca]